MDQASTQGSHTVITDSRFIDVRGDYIFSQPIIINDIATLLKRTAYELRSSLGPHLLLFKDLRPCAVGTRTQILEKVFDWIATTEPSGEDRTTGTSKSSSASILWINGAAGTGKTTIAASLAEKLAEKDILGASFFASRSEAFRSNPKLILPTIACGLAEKSPQFNKHFSHVLEQCADTIKEQDPSFQAEKLIIQPLKEMARHGESLDPFVILIDAVDECQKDHESRCSDPEPPSVTIQLLTVLLKRITSLSPLRFIITCRPERSFQATFDAYTEVVETLVLHDDRWNTESDIRLYLSASLAAIKGCPQSWPSEAHIDDLANYSKDLFIIAETCLRFINNPSDNPVAMLSKLLTIIQNSNTSRFASATIGDQRRSYINHLYNDILARTSSLNSHRAESTKRILGAIVLSQRPLSASALAKLLQKEEGYQIRWELNELHSVLIIPQDDDKEIRLLHQSFGDFITDGMRCEQRFLLDVRGLHLFLAERCLDVWQEELRDHAQPDEDPTSRAHTVLDDKSHVQYAAEFWGEHLRESTVLDSHEIYAKLLELCSTEDVLYWIEYCARRGILRSTLANIHVILRFAEITGSADSPVSKQLRKVEKWIRRYFTLIGEYPSQTYHLPYAPSLIDDEEMESPLSWIDELTGSREDSQVEGESDAHLIRIRTQDCVMCATYRSREDDRILAGNLSKTLHAWDMLSGVEVGRVKLESDLGAISVVQGDRFVICGCRDGSLKKIDLTNWSSESIEMLDEGITAVDTTTVGEELFIIAGNWNSRVRIWNSRTRKYTEPRSNPGLAESKSVSAVAISADGAWALAIWSDVGYVWKVKQRREEKIYDFPPNVTKASFGPHTNQIFVYGTSEGVVKLWSPHGIQDLSDNTLEGTRVVAISFSWDETTVVSLMSQGSKSWIDLTGTEGQFRRRIMCHEEEVECMALSRDGRHIVTGNTEAGSINVWRRSSVKPEVPKVDGIRCSPITCVEISPSLDLAFAGAEDGTFSLWTLQGSTARKLPDFEGYMPDFSVSSAAFSRCETMLVVGLELTKKHSVEEEGLVYLINVDDPLQIDSKLRMLKVGGPAYLAAFSPTDSRILATSAAYLAVEIWDLDTERVITKLSNRHHGAERLNDFAFSLDGTKIATANSDSDCHIIVWDVVSGKAIWSYKFERNVPETVAFTTDGNGVLAMTLSRAVGLFHIEDGGVIAVIGDGAARSKASSRSYGGIPAELVRDLSKYKGKGLIGEGIHQRNLSSSNSRVLTRYLADVDRSARNKDRETVMIIEDGWLSCLARERRRIMPFPKGLDVSNACLVQRGTYVVMGSRKGRVHIVEISGLLRKLDSFDSR